MTDTLAILDAANAAERQHWIATWSRWPDREVQAHPSYLELFAGPAERIRAALVERDTGCVLYPFIQRPLPEGFDLDGAKGDVTSPYGYGGPYAWGADVARVATEFWPQFDAWARAHGIVSEVVRLAVGDVQLLPYPGHRTERLRNVIVPTALDADVLWKQYAHKVRKNVNKARAAGVRITTDPSGARLADFLDIYLATMTRRDAGATYRFSRAFFERLNDALPGQYMYFHALVGDRVISTELALVSASRIYSFLGGTDESAFDLRPNDLLKHEMIRWAHEHGKREFVLGGGYRGDDGIFRYKQSFAPESSVPFYTGERVFDPALYDRMVTLHHEAATRAGLGVVAGYFPAYRAPYASAG